MANIKAEVLKLAKGNVYMEHDRFIQNFPESLRSDENVILIMCAITLFSSNRPRTIHKDVIKLEQVWFLLTLLKVLDSETHFIPEFLLLFAAKIPGECLRWMSSSIHFPAIDQQHQRFT